MKPAAQMTVTLTPELERFVREEVESGEYASNSEVMRAALRAWREQRETKERRLKALDDAIARGIADADAGRVMPLDEAMTRLRQKLGLPAEPRGDR